MFLPSLASVIPRCFKYLSITVRKVQSVHFDMQFAALYKQFFSIKKHVVIECILSRNVDFFSWGGDFYQFRCKSKSIESKNFK